jgi:hypothetical protein
MAQQFEHNLSSCRAIEQTRSLRGESIHSHIVHRCWSLIAAKQADDASLASIRRGEITTMELVACR